MAPVDSSPVLPLDGRLPKLIAFDLDYTLWDFWVDTHVTPPLKRRNDSDVNLIYDKHGERIGFYSEVPSILLQLHKGRIHIAAASRTSAPRAARQALTELLVPGELNSVVDDPAYRAPKAAEPQLISSIRLFDTMEIYPGSKIAHFKAIHEKTGIPYNEMVGWVPDYREATKELEANTSFQHAFFRSFTTSRNREVTKLGVTFVLVQNGMTKKLLESGIESWRKFGLSPWGKIAAARGGVLGTSPDGFGIDFSID
ncbi:BZ3500_MvSof-1268-A1-R1_Chr3-1g05770 [Microbotryum saponariae]|uniref:BZ3500_MvSof-1268-A1-R1_Chr3-1g05770 protein n=1 Tax=Microbotryum saponariae TaxID=289078 RepID=A0A2X0LIE3_9BASI|nr:BZ3500_MvSof-1268-A1-R1_Chr3-1g05770 [Microbotryum saponariae]SDA04960.1 BZ3501_MvSof-1269-A2-R1_Chr3-1g05440 [Microbotryum saponariae]